MGASIAPCVPSKCLVKWCIVVHTAPMNKPLHPLPSALVQAYADTKGLPRDEVVPPAEPDQGRVRLTISVTPEVHAMFTRLAKGCRMSLGRAMGEWLEDTLEAVEFTVQKVEQARVAPKLVMREMHAYAQGLVDETGALMEKIRADGVKARVEGAAAPGTRSGAAAAAPLPPRLVIRGGKSHDKVGKGGRK